MGALSSPVSILVLSVLGIQLFVKYWGQVEPDLRVGGFYVATALARTVVPFLIVVIGLRVPWKQLGFGLPQIPRREIVYLLALFVVGTGALWLFLGVDQSYRQSYSSVRMGTFEEKLARWLAFTLSTSIPWEILHRGFLLHGLRALCRREGLSDTLAMRFAILFTLCFEMLYHFIKSTPQEALGFWIGSPVLSALAFRYKSLWIPLLIHTWIETLWFTRVWF